MMELKTCALVATIITSVIANPYGYGVKGGAGSSAASGASAGAFGSHSPIAVPIGSGFSGSITKSSSSSSSSSSASSSSSSSSFSYSATGAGGATSPGSIGNTGCATGLCQNSGANDISTNYGTTGASIGYNGYNAAGAAITTGSEPNCQDSTCISNADNCLSGPCVPKLESPALSLEDKCTSGQCGHGSQTGPSASQYDDSDDIPFETHSSKFALDQTSSDHKGIGHSAGYNCQSGNCDTSNILKSHTNAGPRPLTISDKQTSLSSSGNTQGYQTPSVHLETPKQDSNCNSGSCNTEQSRPGYDNTVSSYNVPIHGSYDTNKQKPECEGGKCDNPQKGSYSTTPKSWSNQYINSQDSYATKDSYYPSTSICTGADCDSVTNGQMDNFGLPAKVSPTNCNSPSCNSPYAVTAPTGSNVQPGQINFAQNTNNDREPNSKVPIYTGAHGIPPKVLTSNPSLTYPSTSSHEEPIYGSGTTGCSSPNCFGQVPSPVIHTQSVLGGNKPNGDTKPLYTGGFGGPSGILKPNEYHIPRPVVNKPTLSVNPTQNTPSTFTTGCEANNCYGTSTLAGTTTATITSQTGTYGTHKESGGGVLYTGGFGAPAGMLKPNEFHNQHKPDTNAPEYTVSLPSTSHSSIPSEVNCKTPNCNGQLVTTVDTVTSGHGVTKPSIVVDTSKDSSPYVGGFGEPADFDIRQPSHYLSQPGTSLNKTPVKTSLIGCTTPNCSPHNGVSTVVPSAQSAFAVTKPISYSPYGYTSNYPRPVGVTYPSPIAVAPITPNTAIPLSLPNIYSAGCKTANCAENPTRDITADVSVSSDSSAVNNQPDNIKPFNSYHNGNFAAPTGSTHFTETHNLPSTLSSTICKSSDCSDIASTSTGGNAQAASYAGSQQTIPEYISSYGTPSDLLKPHDTGTSQPNGLAKPSGTSLNAACNTGYCNPKVTLPSSPSYNVASSGSQATALSSASANALAYTGGFGGPPGFLQPYDDGKVDFAKLIAGQKLDNQNINSGPFVTGSSLHGGNEAQTGTVNNIGALADSSSSTYSGSIASSNTGSYGYGSHQGAKIKGAGPCDGGCGTYQDGLSAVGTSAAAGARSLSSAGSIERGGSFASSSSSAHASIGAYTKGGYGKR